MTLSTSPISNGLPAFNLGPTTKWTIDAAGNWVRIPMVLTKTDKGWSESQPIPKEQT